MNGLWAGMIIVGIMYAVFTGQMPEVTNGALDSAKEAVTLCITMLGVMSFWMGVMEIASDAGLVEMATEKLRPVIRFLFPKIPENHPAKTHISMNFIANFLGLGWAATPAGLQAMKELENLENERRGSVEINQCCGIASDEMCTFLIMNISSLQLIPVNIIAYRSQYGSVSPAGIVGAGIVATTVSTLVAVIFCKVMGMRKRTKTR